MEALGRGGTPQPAVPPHFYVQDLGALVGEFEHAWTLAMREGWTGERPIFLKLAARKIGEKGTALGLTQVADLAQSLSKLFESIAHGAPPPTPEQRFYIEQLLALLRSGSLGPSKENSTAHPARPTALPGPELRLIYLLCDDPESEKQLSAEISGQAHSIRIFRNSRDLQKALEYQSPIAILIDASKVDEWISGALMPVSPSLWARPPVIYLADNGDFASRLEAFRAGGDAYLARPLEASEILTKVTDLTENKSLEPYRILIVGQDPLVVHYLALFLQLAGMTTESLFDPTEALELVSQFGPDLILSEVDLPTCSGFEMAGVLRQHEAFAHIPFAFLSPQARKETSLSVLSLGGDAFLTSPIGPGQLIASVASRAQRGRAIRSMMARDGLTGLLNHSSLKERLTIEIARARRASADLAFVMVDVDNFKHVNDRYGHATGDRVLKTLALTLRQRVRATDVVGRYGGEEFGVILLDADEATARRVLDSVRKKLASASFRHRDGDFSVTISGGIATSRTYSSIDDLREAADAALYKAKRNGRNRVESSG